MPDTHDLAMIQSNHFADSQISTSNHLAVTSLSLDVVDLVATAGLRARVESAFTHACNMVTSCGRRFSLVDERIGDGPYNVVVGHGQTLPAVYPKDQITGDGCWLILPEGLRIDLRSARPWDPCPNYRRLGSRPDQAMRHIAWLRQVVPYLAPAASLAAQPACPAQGTSGSHPASSLVQVRADQLTNDLLAAYRQCNLARIETDVRQLLGLGPGLTPAGDDWLAGWLIGLRALASMVKSRYRTPVAVIGQTVVDAAAGRTTGFSQSFLAAAANGTAPWPWHDFLYALVGADREPVQRAVGEILRRGATSGADMLAGFLAAFSEPSYA